MARMRNLIRKGSAISMVLIWAGLLILTGLGQWVPFSLLAFVLWSVLMLRGTMNLVQGIGPIYWLTRDTGVPGDQMFTLGYMRETDYPWRYGWGIQVRFNIYLFQLGVCKRHEMINISDGLLRAIGGRNMETGVDEISTWQEPERVIQSI